MFTTVVVVVVWHGECCPDDDPRARDGRHHQEGRHEPQGRQAPHQHRRQQELPHPGPRRGHARRQPHPRVEPLVDDGPGSGQWSRDLLSSNHSSPGHHVQEAEAEAGHGARQDVVKENAGNLDIVDINRYYRYLNDIQILYVE